MRKWTTMLAATVAVVFCGGFVAAAESEATRRLQARTHELREDVIKINDQVYVATGYSPANVSMIVGEKGLIIVDTGMAVPHAERILAEFRKISSLPIRAIVYTHSHGDHTGGASVFAAGGNPDIWARDVFGHEGDAFQSAGLMINRVRGARQAGFKLPPEKRINNGVARAFWPKRKGAVFGSGGGGFVKPTQTFSEDRIRVVIEGVTMDFVAAPGETHDQMFVWLPKTKTLFSGDNFYQSWPNLYAIRGTGYRDVRAWADANDKMLKEGAVDLIPGHNRPILGAANVKQALTDYRDAIRFVFDKTIEGMNKGLTPDELVDYVKLPAHLAEKDYLGEYYGNIEWAVRAIFTGYLGWYDGNPTTLFSLPVKEEAQRMADLAGGATALKKRCQAALDAKDYQWSAQVADHLIALAPAAPAPKRMKALALEGLAQNVLTATARNYYLSVAQELWQAAGRSR